MDSSSGKAHRHIWDICNVAQYILVIIISWTISSKHSQSKFYTCKNDTFKKNYNVTGYLKNKAFTLYLMLIFIAPLPRHYTCFKVSMMCTCNLLINPYNFIHSFLYLICIHGLSYLQSWTKMLIHLRKMLCISVLL